VALLSENACITRDIKPEGTKKSRKRKKQRE